jgi:hypothetical protein
VEELSIRFARFSVKFGANPPGYLIETIRNARYVFFRAQKPTPEPSTFSPDRYRISLGIMVLVVLLCLIVILAWDFFI